jgi:hypothetical protein
MQPSMQQQLMQQQSHNANQVEARTFAGTITKSNGKYVLEDPTTKTPFSLDDQKTARQFAGKSVVVTGSLDPSKNIIHVQKIESAA